MESEDKIGGMGYRGSSPEAKKVVEEQLKAKRGSEISRSGTGEQPEDDAQSRMDQAA